MKNIKGLIFGAGVLGSAFVALGWWCDRCNVHHKGACPLDSLLGCGYGYNCGYGCDEGYDTEEEEALLEQMRARHRRHHETNLERGIRGLLRHVHNEQDLQRVQQALNEKRSELRRGAGYDCFNWGACGCSYDPCSPEQRFGNPHSGCGSYDPYSPEQRFGNLRF